MIGDGATFELTEFLESLPVAFFAILILCPAMTCIPSLVDSLLQKNVPVQRRASGVQLILCWNIYSIATLLLATLAFGTAEWKGERGWHWSYYLCDMPMAFFSIPLFVAAAFIIAQSLVDPDPRKRFSNPLLTLASVYNFLISVRYAIASACCGFGESLTAIVPGSVAVCYGLYACTLIKHRNYSLRRILLRPLWLLQWLIIATSLELLKIPFAIEYYKNLPAEVPEGCFVVTAASKGHPKIVGSFYDVERGKTINRQLNDFWNFETNLKNHFPAFHRQLRKIYNRIGPRVAGLIRFRWQADIVYLLLKPAQLICRWLTRGPSR